MAARLLILADDFTGALDTGVRLAASGVTTRVVTRRTGRRQEQSCGASVLVLDTESRHTFPRRAARIVHDHVRSAMAEGTSFFYKKTDSTLRGNVGAELAALLSASKAERLFFVPALPAAGRTTVGGVALVDGVPLHRSSFAHDALDPARESEIPSIIGRQTDVEVHVVPGGSDWPIRNPRGRQILIFDAETDADLHDIGRRIRASGPPRASAGCSGFAAVLPQLLDLPRGPVAEVTLAPPMLVVCGSRHEASREQVRRAETQGFPSTVIDRAILAAPGQAGSARRGFIGNVLKDLASTGTAILKTTASESGSARGGIWGHRSERSFARAVGELVREILSAGSLCTLVIFGGDTAFGIVDQLGIESVTPVREILPGVVVSCAEYGGRDVHLVTKAGGFGPSDVLARIRDAVVEGA